MRKPGFLKLGLFHARRTPASCDPECTPYPISIPRTIQRQFAYHPALHSTGHASTSQGNRHNAAGADQNPEGVPTLIFLGQSNRNGPDLRPDLHYCADPCSIQPMAVTLTGLETTRRLYIPVSSSSRFLYFYDPPDSLRNLVVIENLRVKRVCHTPL